MSTPSPRGTRAAPPGTGAARGRRCVEPGQRSATTSAGHGDRGHQPRRPRPGVGSTATRGRRARRPCRAASRATRPRGSAAPSSAGAAEHRHEQRRAGTRADGRAARSATTSCRTNSRWLDAVERRGPPLDRRCCSTSWRCEQLEREHQHPRPERARRRRAAMPGTTHRSARQLDAAATRRRGDARRPTHDQQHDAERERAVAVHPHPADRQQPARVEAAPPRPGSSDGEADQADHERPLRPQRPRRRRGTSAADGQPRRRAPSAGAQEPPRQAGEQRRPGARRATRTPPRPPRLSAVA